jgi:oligoribonuclease
MIVWVDTETTGLDPETDKLLEIAVVITDDNLTEVFSLNSVLKQESPVNPDELDPYVATMHAKSGLLNELDGAEFTVEDVQDILSGFLVDHFGAEALKRAPLAGSSVGFDRAFLKKQMPYFESLLSYRTIDVSTIKELANRWNKKTQSRRKKKMDNGGVAHRALDDIHYSIEEARYYRKHLFRRR